MNIGDVISFTYKGGRKVKGEIMWISNKQFQLILQTDYIGRNEEWFIGEKKYFNIKECKKIKYI